MKKATDRIVRAFRNGERLILSYTFTNGTSIWLHGIKIASKRLDGSIWIKDEWQNNTTGEKRYIEIIESIKKLESEHEFI